MRRAEATRSRDLLLHIVREGYPEEAYFSFSFSPILDDSGSVGGVFCPVIETTEKVIGDRRLRTLRDLAARCKGAESEASVYARGAEVLAGNLQDVPFLGSPLASMLLAGRLRSSARKASGALTRWCVPAKASTWSVFSPDIDGYELARRARRQIGAHDLTLIALTGWGQEDDRRLSDAGIDHHLVKPVDFDILYELLSRLPGATSELRRRITAA